MIETTVVGIQTEYSHNDIEIYTTLEGENPGGSIKDHMVIGALSDLLENNSLNGKILTEASAGSTALSLAHYCEVLRIPLTLFIPEGSSLSFQKILTDKKAKLNLVPLDKAMDIYQKFCMESDVVPFNQHFDKQKKIYYHKLGQTIEERVGAIDLVIGAIGTSHSLLGICDGLKNKPQWVATAEPQDKFVLGIRNFDQVNYSVKDPFNVNLVNERILVKESDFYKFNYLDSSIGKVVFSDSFRVVLGALTLGNFTKYKRIFLVGSTNKRDSHPS